MENAGIHCLCTIRCNRVFDRAELKTEMEKNTNRGHFMEYVGVYDGVPIVFIIWKDNKVVSLVSTYIGSLPVRTAQRFNKSTKVKEDVPCPVPSDRSGVQQTYGRGRFDLFFHRKTLNNSKIKKIVYEDFFSSFGRHGRKFLDYWETNQRRNEENESLGI